jgi:hypothetical protein
VVLVAGLGADGVLAGSLPFTAFVAPSMAARTPAISAGDALQVDVGSGGAAAHPAPNEMAMVLVPACSASSSSCRPESSPSGSCLRLGRRQAWVTRVAPEPPSIPATHDLLIQTSPVREARVGHRAAIPILIAADHLDDLTERELRRELLGSVAKSLAILRRLSAGLTHMATSNTIHIAMRP